MQAKMLISLVSASEINLGIKLGEIAHRFQFNTDASREVDWKVDVVGVLVDECRKRDKPCSGGFGAMT